MKNIYLIIAALGLLLSAGGCSDDFGDMNVKSNAVDKVDPAYFFSNMQQQVFENYQRNVNLYPDLYSQYWANTVSGFGSARYEYVDGWIGNQWKEFYTGSLTESLAIYSQNIDDEYKADAIAMSEIWICYYWSRMTDTYGDIPYFGAGEGESVPYNSQKDIYYDLFERLDVAIKQLSGDASQYSYGEYDHLYDGDVDKWRKFGNSLRLRLAMRLANVDSVKAEAEAKAAVDGPGGLMTSNDDVAKVGMWSEGWYDYLHQMAWNWDNIRASKTFTDQLYNQSTAGEDPRTPIWFTYDVDGVATSKEDAGFATYQGLVNGYNTVPDNAKTDHCTINLEGGYVDFVGSNRYGKSSAMYCPVMFYSEVLFLQSEAAMRGWVSGDANALYLEGVQASMDYVGVDATAATNYIAGLPTLSGTTETDLKQLITQKWVANFPNGVEAWADFRRTDYPDITLPEGGVSASATVADGTWVKRINYPDNQHQQNQVSMPASQNTVGTDRMDIKVWWDTTNTKEKSGGLMSSNI
jgi:hypothetical protein